MLEDVCNQFLRKENTVVRHYFRVILWTVAAFATASAVVWAAEKPSDNTVGQIQKLQERVTQLEARIVALEKKQPVIALPTKPILDGLNILPPSTSVVPAPNALPKGWQEQEFNGMPYYIVPLGGNAK